MSSTVAPWQELYGVAVRSSVDLTKTTSSDSADSSAATVLDSGTISDEGKKLFIHDATAGTGTIGIPGADWKLDSEKFGVPVTNQPVLEVGQQVNEYNKAIGDSAPTAGTGYSFQRGTQEPITTFEFDVDRYTLLPFLFGLFQQGENVGTEVTAAINDSPAYGTEYNFTFPDAADGASPSYFLSLFKTINFPSGELISDAVVTSMSLSASENEPLKASCQLLGHRFVNTNYSTFAGAAGTTNGITDDGSTVSVEFAEMNPLHWNDANVIIGYLSTGDYASVSTHYIVECSAFDVTITSNSTARRYNSRYASKYVNNGYTVQGSLTFPYRSSGVGESYLKDMLTYSASSMTPLPIDIFWYGTSVGSPGSTISTTEMTAYRDMDAYDGTALTFNRDAGDFRITVNAIVQSVPDVNEDESMLTVNFVGANARSGNTVTSHAFELAWFEQIASADYTGTRPS